MRRCRRGAARPTAGWWAGGSSASQQQKPAEVRTCSPESDELAPILGQGQRKLQWFSVPEAAEAVDEPELKDIIRKLG